MRVSFVFLCVRCLTVGCVLCFVFRLDVRCVAAVHGRCEDRRSGLYLSLDRSLYLCLHLCLYLCFAASFLLPYVDVIAQALEIFAAKRTKNKKGVAIPSQMRWVRMYDKLLKNFINHKPPKAFDYKGSSVFRSLVVLASLCIDRLFMLCGCVV